MNKLIMPSGQVASSPEHSKRSPSRLFLSHSLLSMAFRPLFLLASIVSVCVLLMWLGLLSGALLTVGPNLTAVVWHSHEMVYGFAATVAVGFLLTAVQTWTKRSTLPPAAMLCLIALWLSVRVSFWLLEKELGWFILLLQGSWWLLVLYHLAKPIWQSRNRRNYVFVVLLSMMMLLNLAVLYSDLIAQNAQLALHLVRTNILLFTLLIGLLGGRVIPFFTQSGLARIGMILTPRLTPKILEVTLLLSSLLGVLGFFVSYFIELYFSPGYLMLGSGCLHLMRMTYWHSFQSIKVALLWSLHLSYFILALGLILLGLSYFLPALNFSNALHIITIGAVGLMILTMMSRVSLGHTGRALVVSRFMVLAFACLILATFARFTLVLLQLYWWAWSVSAALWIVAFLLFIKVYLPILFAPRHS